MNIPNITELEAEYRSAQMSLSALCSHFKIERSELNNLVAKNGWTRNLAGNVRAVMEENILRRTAGDGPKTQTEVVERAADRGADIVMAHRDDIAKLRRLATKMRDRLEVMVSDGKPLLETGDFKVHPLDSHLMGKTQGTLDGLVKLTDAYSRIILMERQAYNLDDRDPLDPAAMRATIEEARKELLKRGTFASAMRDDTSKSIN